MTYILRRVIFEDRWEAQLEELIAFHRQSGVEEVLFLEQSHQMLMTAWPLEKHRRMAQVYAKMAPELRKEGIGVGINLASIVGHSDMDVPEEWKLPFQHLVHDNLKESRACYCILDSAWQDYAEAVCRIYAEAFQPDRFFIDDDFRPTNHGAYMACFCPLHAGAVSEAWGKEVDPATLLAHVKGDSPEDRRVRRLWQELHGRAEIDVALRVRKVFEELSPNTQVGLMANGEPSHSVSGRKIETLLDALALPEKRPLCPPSSAFYRDVCLVQEAPFFLGHHLGLACSVMRPETEVVSEVEGWPHTRFMKSLDTLRHELLMQAINGAEKFSLNIFDYVVSPLAQEPEYAGLLKDLKPTLEKIVELRRGKKPVGLGLPWKQDLAAHVSYAEGASPWSRGGIHRNRLQMETLTQMGIPIQYTPGACNFLVGEEARAFSDAEIETMLSGGLLLDSGAAFELQERGFGKDLGCWLEKMEPSKAVLERLEDGRFAGEFAGTFCNTKWMKLPPFSGIYQIHPEGAKAVSTFLGFELEEVSPGTVTYENEMGGRVVVFGAPFNPETWLFRNRAFWARRLIEWAARDSLPVMLEGAVNLGPFYFEHPEEGEGLLAVVSSILDPQPLQWKTNLAMTAIELDGGNFCGASSEMSPLSIRFFQTRKRENHGNHA